MAENEGRTTDGTNDTNGGGKQGKNYEMLENAKFWGGRGKNEAKRGLKIGARFQIGGVGRDCIPGGIWGGNSPPPAQGRPTTDPEAENRSKRAENGGGDRKWTQMDANEG